MLKQRNAAQCDLCQKIPTIRESGTQGIASITKFQNPDKDPFKLICWRMGDSRIPHSVLRGVGLGKAGLR